MKRILPLLLLYALCLSAPCRAERILFEDENGKVIIDEATGKPKKDPKTQVP